MTTPPLDACILRKLIAGHSVNGYVDELQQENRLLADAILAVPPIPAQRTKALETALSGNTTKAEILAAVFAADPESDLAEMLSLSTAPTGYNEPDSWKAFTLADAYQERPPVEYVAAKLFALPSLNIVYGAPGTLKSFLMADLAIDAAAGMGWLPPAPWKNDEPFTAIPTKAGPVMWLDFDNGQRRTHDRIAALARARNLPEDTPITYYSMPSPWLTASEKGSIGALSLRIQRNKARLVVIDNLGTVAGNADENSGDMVQVMSNFRQIAEESGAAIVLIHHQRKGNGTIGRAGDSLRGHSSIEASLDLGLLIEREEQSDTIKIKATKVRGVDVMPFSAAFTCDTNDAGELHTARFFGIPAEDTKSGAAVEREILAALYGTALNKTNLVNAVHEVLPDVGVNRIRDYIDRMVNEKKLNKNPGKTNTERIYTRP